MHWYFRSSEEWCRARKGLITASQIQTLLSDFKKYQKTKDEDSLLMFAKAVGQATSEEISCVSWDAAARGHYLEPYAIEEFNAQEHTDYQHIDDLVLAAGVMGWSPDAIYPQEKLVSGIYRLEYSEDTNSFIADSMHMAPTSALEIKCYSAGTHAERKLQGLAGKKLEMKEKWQCAAAMAVCPTLEDVKLVFYAPQLNDMFHVTYQRKELRDEIVDVFEMAMLFCRMKDRLASSSNLKYSEDELFWRCQDDNS